MSYTNRSDLPSCSVHFRELDQVCWEEELAIFARSLRMNRICITYLVFCHVLAAC